MTQPTGISNLVGRNYESRGSLESKERIRTIRQLNPAWITWPRHRIPKGAMVVLPEPQRPFLPTWGSFPYSARQGERFPQLLQRYSRERYKQTLHPNALARLVPILELTNGILNDELEQGLLIYVPDEAIRRELGPWTFPPLNNPQARLTDVTIKIAPAQDWKESHAYTDPRDVAAALYSLYKDKLASNLVKDLLSKNIVKISPLVEQGKNYIVLKGTDRDLLKAIGLDGTWYRVGSEKYAAAMLQYAKETGTFLTKDASVLRSALGGAVKSGASQLAWGTGFTVVIDAVAYVVDGKAEEIMTTKFAVSAANNLANGVISGAAGSVASASAVAMMGAAGGSVVPGIGTAVGFFVGLFVGFALNRLDVKWV